MRHACATTAMLALVAGLAACALSPHTVDINPTLRASPAVEGNGRSIALAVRDARTQPAFGTRGGVYDKTSYIRPAGDVAGPVRAALAARLAEAGFVVQPPGAEAETTMEVILRDIGYVASGSPAVRKVETRAVVEVTVTRGDRSYSGESKVSESKEVLKAPSPMENERLINTAISQALDRMLQHPELNAFLR